MSAPSLLDLQSIISAAEKEAEQLRGEENVNKVSVKEVKTSNPSLADLESIITAAEKEVEDLKEGPAPTPTPAPTPKENINLDSMKAVVDQLLENPSKLGQVMEGLKKEITPELMEQARRSKIVGNDKNN